LRNSLKLLKIKHDSAIRRFRPIASCFNALPVKPVLGGKYASKEKSELFPVDENREKPKAD